MKLAFQQQLDHELLRSERRRTVIIMTLFFSAIILRAINSFYIKPDQASQEIEALSAVWFFPVMVILFELLCYLYINRRIKVSKRRIPLVLQYVNTAMEILLPGFIIIWVAKRYPTYDMLQSPAIMIYFIFIILSTLRLNFMLSFFCGLLAALSYAGFSLFLFDHFNSNDAARAFTLLFAGIGAGLVAQQIRSGINNSLHESEKRQKAENLFGQQISMEIAEKMLENDGKIESKRMHVAVMFVDIRNFTGFVAGKTPEEIVQYQNAFFSIIINTVTKHHGIVNQLMGDGCMITFGAPVAMSNPGAIAAEAALEIIHELKIAGKKGILPRTRVGIGIHNGDAVTGNIGTETRKQYSITGNVVIMASRIEQLTKEFNAEVLVSEQVAHCLNKQHRPECMGMVSMKGMRELHQVYKLA